MRICAFALIAFGSLIQSAGTMAADERPPLKDVSSVRIASYGNPSTVIRDRDQVKSIVDELRQLRGKPWRRADARITCYATLVLLSDTRTVALFRVIPELVVEPSQKKGQSSYSLDLGQADAPKLITLLAGLPPAKDCN